MKQCPNCNASVKDTAKFCTRCRFNLKEYEEKQTAEPYYCSECGEKLSEEDLYCPNCSAPRENADEAAEPTLPFVGADIPFVAPVSEAGNDDLLNSFDAFLDGELTEMHEEDIRKSLSAITYEDNGNGTYTITG